MDNVDFLSKFSIAELVKKENPLMLNDVLKLIDSDECSEKNLIILHQKTKLFFPSYLLRLYSLKFFNDFTQINDEVLKVNLESGSILSFLALKKKYHNDLSKMSDEFIVIGAQQNENSNEEINYLTERYTKFIKRIINNIEKRGYYFRGHGKEDLIQEATIGFLKAVEVYKVERRTKFKDFSRYVIERHLGTLMHRSNNFRNRTLNESISYNTPVSNATQNTTFEDLIEGNSVRPDEIVMQKQFYKEIKKKLTGNEREVLIPYSEGYTYEEIAFTMVQKKGVIDFNGLNYEQVSLFLKAIGNNGKNNKNRDTDLEFVYNNLDKMPGYRFENGTHYLYEYSYEKIKEEMKRGKKSVDNTIQRFRNKGIEYLNQILNKNYSKVI